MGLFDTLKNVAKSAEQLASTVQKIENAANSVQHLANGQKPAATPAPTAAPVQPAAASQPAAPAQPEKAVGKCSFPQDPAIPGSRELKFEAWYSDGNGKFFYCISCPPGFVRWDTEADISLAYLPECKEEYAPEVLGGEPYLALNIDPELSSAYRRFLETGQITFDSIEETGNPQMPHRTMCRIQGDRFIMRAYHLSGVPGNENSKEYALHLCYPSSLKGTETESVIWQALDQVAATLQIEKDQ